MLLCLAGGFASALLVPGLRFDHDARSMLRPDRAARGREAVLQREFGAEDILLLAWEADPTSLATFAEITRITGELDRLDGLEEVLSLASVPVGIGRVVRRLRSADFATVASRARVREALNNAAGVYATRLYSPDLDVVAVASSLRPGSRAERAATLKRVRAVARTHPGMHVSGVTPFAIEASEYALADLRRIGLLALAVAVVVLFLLCGSFGETAVAVVATGLPPLFALGFAALLGIRLTAMGAALFPVLAVVGITSSVHLLHGYRAEAEHHPPEVAAWRAARRLRAPILLSLATSAAAFFTLSLTGVPAFATAGTTVGLGLLTAIPVVLLGIPAALVLFRLTGRPAARRLDRLLFGLGLFVRRRERAVLAGSLLVAVAAGVAMSQSRLQVQVLQAFRKESGIAKTYAFLEKNLTATIPLDLVLDGRGRTDEELLADLRRFSEGADRTPGVAGSLGLDDLVDYGKRISPIPVGDPGALLYLRSQLPKVVRRFEHAGRYRIKLTLRDGTGPETLDRLRELAAGCDAPARLTGLFLEAVETTRSLLADLARGVLAMLALLALLVTIALRSWRAGLAAVLPNLLPPLVVFGAAAALRIPLDVSAAAVGAVAVGLAVDDSLHMLFAVARERRAGRDLDRALLETQRRVGPALILSTVVLVAGLACLQASSFGPTARFGTYCAASCAVALLADLVCLPALLRRLRAL